jgi:hypothetical protein
MLFTVRGRSDRTQFGGVQADKPVDRGDQKMAVDRVLRRMFVSLAIAVPGPFRAFGAIVVAVALFRRA